MPDRNASPEPTDAPASAKKMSIDDLELPPSGPADIISESGFGTRLVREAEGDDQPQEDPAHQSELAPPTADVDEALPEFPPPGPANYVTDGYPHRETDPRNWPKPEERLSRDTQTGRNGAAPAMGQRAPDSRLKVLLRRWRR